MIGLAISISFSFSDCGKQIVGNFSGIRHSTGEAAGPTEVDSSNSIYYGNRGCGVFKGGIQNQKGFLKHFIF